MSFIKRLIPALIATSFSLAAVANAEPTQFSSAQEMFEEFGDYDTSNGTLAILTEAPLHIRLARPVVKNDHPDIVKYELQRAVIYGIYQTFIHTDTADITVTAQPMLTTFNPRGQELLDSPAYKISITRDQALEAVQEFLDVDELSDLKTQGQYGLSWSDGFNSLYYEDREPGLKVFFAELEK